ncbi:MAG TPA: hypothetical protein VGN57_05945 [Pirellulaceae bacterium]|jgi:uncharacterized protein (TIGR02588 family)|nr:hypothetical protein [Pirellulaceae bacterium]
MESRSDKNWLEWLVFAVGAALVSATVGYLAYDALAVTPRPPKLEVRLGDPVAAPGGFSVPVVVRNRGTKAAETVVVRVEKESDGGESESAELTLDFVPGEASRKGAVVFSGDPASSKLTALPVSFQQP